MRFRDLLNLHGGLVRTSLQRGYCFFFCFAFTDKVSYINATNGIESLNEVVSSRSGSSKNKIGCKLYNDDRRSRVALEY